MQIASLSQAVTERDGQIGALREQEVQLQEQVRDMLSAAQESGMQIASLSQAVAERDGQINSLNQGIADRDGQITAILSSRSWQITAPLRAIGFKIRLMRNRVAIAKAICGVTRTNGLRDGYRLFKGRRLLLISGTFDANYYLRQNPDVAAARIDPALHYLVHGAVEGRNPNTHFDTSWYLRQNLDVAKSGVNPLVHYIKFGAGEGRDPSSLFSSSAYLAANLDVAAAGMNPLLHYLKFGKAESRQYTPVKQLRTRCLPAVDTSNRPAVFVREEQTTPLPTNFNPSVYLELNPDVRLACVDPVSHYLQHGYIEGRQYAYPKLTCLRSDPLSGKQGLILVVCHEASRSGAPIVGLNLIQQLSATHDVVALLLGEGTLLDEFVRAAVAGVWLCADLRFFSGEVAAMAVVDELCNRYAFSAAIVNSIECRSVLPALHRRGVPGVSLLHEFAAYTRPLDAFPQAMFWSMRAVFSARVTRDDALRQLELCDATHVTILPQGKCASVGSSAAAMTFSELPMIGGPSGAVPVRVLGVGAVHYRKGVDLFIECARKMRVGDPAIEYHFYWVGGGYQPSSDMSYSVYLDDQIRRAGLSQHITILGETDQLETIYSQVDLFLLTSRLDPLPNVAIDAAMQGIPLLCFAETTGIADFLEGIQLGKYLVADYLDTADMAAKAIALARSSELRKTVSATLSANAAAQFYMPDYVASLRDMLDEVVASQFQEGADVAEILSASVLQPKFCVHPAHAKLTERLDCDEDIARNYVRSWATGLYRRKPFPGFHPAVYANLDNAVGTDPLAHYLRCGCPKGPWQWPVLTPNEPLACENVLRTTRVALHIHGYYPELIDQMLLRLAHNTVQPDLFVTVTSELQRLEVREKMRDYRGRVVRLEVVPNRGRDIGPFLTMMAGDTLVEYDLVGHLHTKKSATVSDATVGLNWYVFLLENLLGGDAGGPMLDRIVTTMLAPTGPQMIYPDDPYVFGDESNRTILEQIATRANLPTPPLYHGFPVGSMFWARPAVLQPLFDLGLSSEDWPDEPLPYDGTLLHALERALGLLTWGRPGAFATTYVPGITR